MKKALALVLGGLVCAAALADAVIYENDFATRTSAGVIPMSEWRTYDYATDLLASTNGVTPFVDSTNENASKMQDGWIKTRDSNTDARVWAGTIGEADHAAVLGSTKTGSKRICFVKQRIGNAFTNGTITIQFDFQPPASWGGYGYPNDESVLRRATLSFGDEAFYSPAVAQPEFYAHTVGSVGVALHGPEGGRKRKVYYNARQDFGNTNMTEQVVTAGDWLRAVATIDLDSRKWGFSMFEMGSHPAVDTATPASAVYSASDLPFADDSVTGISSIALGGIGVFWGNSNYDASTAPTAVARFDNIRIWHNGAECYENDFATRRWRTFGGTAAHTYVADCLVTNRVENEVYIVSSLAASGTSIVPARENDGTTVQTPGPDGWRRVHKDGAAQAWPRKETVDGKDYTYLRFNCDKDKGSNYNFAFLAHCIGTKLTSGKVRLSVDTRLPTSWAYDSSKASVLWVTLGSDSYYAGNPGTYNTYRYAAVGIRAQSDGNKVTYVPKTGDSVNSLPDTGTITVGHWYRIVVEADIDAGNYVYKVYEQGTGYPDSETADGTLIYTSPAVAKKDSSTISCFSLAAYYCPVYFDNVKIWHIPTGSAAETLLYENYFTSRTIYAQDERVAPLGGTLALNPVGQDGWTHLYVNNPPLFIDLADGNPALTFSRYRYELYGAQDLGQTVKSGRLVVQADMRPPKGWLANGGSAYLRLGGDAHIQGSLRDDDTYFLKNIAMGFGLKNRNSGNVGNLYTNSTIVAYSGDNQGGGVMMDAVCDVDTTHWYRFVATADMSRSQYDVTVYDMGAEHPTLATSTPANPVATFSALPFRRAKRDLGGISCISASSDKTAQSIYDQSLEPLIDNIRVSHQEPGMMIFVK